MEVKTDRPPAAASKDKQVYLNVHGGRGRHRLLQWRCGTGRLRQTGRHKVSGVI